MSPVILLGAGAAALYFLTRNGGTGGKVINQVRASSGRKWEVEFVKRIGDDAFFDVWAPQGTFGPHERMRALRYRQTGSDMKSRKFVTSPFKDSDPYGMLKAAKADFGVA